MPQLTSINSSFQLITYTQLRESFRTGKFMQYDIIIIGAGPAGLSFARALAGTNLKILMVEKSPTDELREPPEDGREIALTHLSVKLMKELGAWERIDEQSISPIEKAKVLNGTSSYFLNFDTHNTSLEALGYLVPNHLIRKAFYEEVAHLDNVEILTDTSVTNVHTNSQGGLVKLSNGNEMETALIVAADSRFSTTRRMMGIGASMHDFSRTAIVCRMAHEKPHQQTAFECFQYGKTLAILPMSGKLSSVVITVSSDKADDIINKDETQFNLDVQNWFGNRLGEMQLVGKRHAYPLVAVHASHFIANRFALVGDAAVGMHPVTAHGFNLGIRGASTLAREIKNALSQSKDFASATVLEKYETQHMRVTKPLYWGTNGIVSLFTNESLPAKSLRNVILKLANNFPPIKHLITSKLTETGASL